MYPFYLADREQLLREPARCSGADVVASRLPIPRCLQLVRSGPVACPMLRPLEKGVVVVVAEIPELVRADASTPARANGTRHARCDANCRRQRRP